MSLRLQAADDLLGILEDVDGGFGWPITVTNPEGVSASLTGYSADVGTTISPETGMLVAGRRASVALPIARLTASGLGMPRAIANQGSKPWIVVVDDIAGEPRRYKVSHAMPDRALGIVTCSLEAIETR